MRPPRDFDETVSSTRSHSHPILSLSEDASFPSCLARSVQVSGAMLATSNLSPNRSRCADRRWVWLLTSCCGAWLAFGLRAAEVTLAWDANLEPDVAGYRLHYDSPVLPEPIVVDVGKRTSATVTDLLVGESYSFHVTCYNTSGLQSDPSNSVEFTVPYDTGSTRLTGVKMTSQGMEMRWASTPGALYSILYKDDLGEPAWRPLDQIRAVGSSMYWMDTSAAAVPRRFYRLLE